VCALSVLGALFCFISSSQKVQFIVTLTIVALSTAFFCSEKKNLGILKKKFTLSTALFCSEKKSLPCSKTIHLINGVVLFGKKIFALFKNNSPYQRRCFVRATRLLVHICRSTHWKYT
jgi:hypothetical protein